MSKSEEAKAIKGLETDVKYYARQYLRDGLSLEDLQQEGFMGALHGVRKWDETRGASLRTYASIWIQLYVKRAAQSGELTVSLDWVAPDAATACASGAHAADRSLHDILPSRAKSPEDICAEREPIERALGRLTPQQLSVIRARFVEDGTCVDAGKTAGVSKSEANRIEMEAIRKMQAS